MIVEWYNGRDDESTNVQLPDIGRSTATIYSTSENPVDPDGKRRESGEDSPTADIEMLEATTFYDILISDDIIKTLALRIWECS